MTRRVSRLSSRVAVAFIAFASLVAPGAPTALAAGPPPGLNVRDVANPALQPFQRFFLIIIKDNFAGGSATFTVPAGKRLVIEYASYNILLPSSQAVGGVSIGVETSSGNQFPIDHEIPVLYTVPDVGGQRFVGASMTRLYADPGSTVTVRVGRNSGAGEEVAGVSVSGYFVTLP